VRGLGAERRDPLESARVDAFLGHRVLDGPGERMVRDFLPAVLSDCEVGAAWEILVLRQRARLLVVLGGSSGCGSHEPIPDTPDVQNVCGLAAVVQLATQAACMRIQGAGAAE
jgi:hypothetical protein